MPIIVFLDCMTKVIEILQQDLAQNGFGQLTNKTCFCVHTLTSNPFHGVQSCYTIGMKITNH